MNAGIPCKIKGSGIFVFYKQVKMSIAAFYFAAVTPAITASTVSAESGI